jgi:hypothetical protein
MKPIGKMGAFTLVTATGLGGTVVAAVLLNLLSGRRGTEDDFIEALVIGLPTAMAAGGVAAAITPSLAAAPATGTGRLPSKAQINDQLSPRRG